MDRKRINKQAFSKARKFVKLAKTKGLKVQKAYLFGSYAKGTDKEWSDIDVCLVIKNFRDSIEKRIEIQNFVIDHEELHRVEVHAFCLADFNNRYLSLPSEIKKTGIEIKV